ncbi:oligosaccharide flippase family protein [Bradyrhizobium sp. USDA 4469]
MNDSVAIPLKMRIYRAGFWSLLGFGSNMVIRFGTNLIMTRLLAPEMFGIMAISTTVMMGLAMFSDIGIRQTIIQNRRGREHTFLNTAWVAQILRGLLLWAAALLLSLCMMIARSFGLAPTDSIYANSLLPYVVAASSATAMIAGFESTKLIEASRALDLRRVTNVEVASQLAGLCAMLIWALFDRSIWVLVVGGIAAGAARAILSHYALEGTPNRWEWDTTAFRELLRFGGWIFLASALGFFISNADRLELAALVTPAVFGVYVIAFLTFSTFEQLLVKITGDVSFPALSEIVRDRPTELKGRYYQFRRILSIFANISAGALFASGATLVKITYDHRYADAGWMLEILSACLLFTPFQISSQCFLALGLSRTLSTVALFRCVTLVTFIPLGFHLAGLQGALWGIVASRSSILPLVLYYKLKHNLLDARLEIILFSTVLLGVGLGEGINRLLG